MVDALDAFRTHLERSAEPADRTVLVADRCLGVLVPYVVQRPTLVSAEPWQAGYERLVPDARAATTIVEGGPEGERLAREHGVDYVLLDKDCGGPALAGAIAYENEELLVVDPRPQAARS
jgi:hypothetical protein